MPMHDDTTCARCKRVGPKFGRVNDAFLEPAWACTIIKDGKEQTEPTPFVDATDAEVRAVPLCRSLRRRCGDGGGGGDGDGKDFNNVPGQDFWVAPADKVDLAALAALYEKWGWDATLYDGAE